MILVFYNLFIKITAQVFAVVIEVNGGLLAVTVGNNVGSTFLDKGKAPISFTPIGA